MNGTRSAVAGVNGAIRLTFGRLLGKNSVDLTHYATAAYRIRSIVVAQDITGSFADTIDDRRRRRRRHAGHLTGFNVPADRIGMQMFTGDSVQFTPLSNLQTNYGRFAPNGKETARRPVTRPRPAGSPCCNKLDLDPAIGGPFDHAWVPACSLGEGTAPTRAPPSSARPTSCSRQAQPYETRVIVLITDGEPACCSKPARRSNCTTAGACPDARARYGVDMADAAGRPGIDIFTVSFGASVIAVGLQRVAGTRYRRRVLNTPDDTQLSSILVQIAGNDPHCAGR